MNANTNERATAALEALYAHHDEHGGVWPDTSDESEAIREALGLREGFARADDALDEIWEFAQTGATPADIAAMHVSKLRARNVDGIGL